MQTDDGPAKRGPKPLPTGRKRRNRALPLSDDELDSLRAAAAAAGQPLTVWMRGTLLAAAAAPPARVRRKGGPVGLRQP